MKWVSIIVIILLLSFVPPSSSQMNPLMTSAVTSITYRGYAGEYREYRDDVFTVKVEYWNPTEKDLTLFHEGIRQPDVKVEIDLFNTSEIALPIYRQLTIARNELYNPGITVLEQNQSILYNITSTIPDGNYTFIPLQHCQEGPTQVIGDPEYGDDCPVKFRNKVIPFTIIIEDGNLTKYPSTLPDNWGEVIYTNRQPLQSTHVGIILIVVIFISFSTRIQRFN